MDEKKAQLVAIVADHAPLFTAELCKRAGLSEDEGHPILLGLIRERVLTFSDGYRVR